MAKKAKNGRRTRKSKANAEVRVKVRARRQSGKEFLERLNPFQGLKDAVEAASPKAVVEVYDARSDAIAALARAIESNNQVLQACASHLTSAPNYQRARQTLR